ncbi:MAG: UDPglucose--hexose-phosphate uridylyltransferase [Thermoanaerobaculia bacterium]|nr:UDPglucose--hexose-phosphate uridylyltransferase [Thermoanaerobaculia bacterium]
MTERTPITNDPVILAPEREQRPNVFEGAPCPFCPGAEDQTPPEIARDGEPWRIRVFPNRYPPTEHAEVIVESAKHEDAFDALPPDHAARIVEMYFERYRAIEANYVSIFKNHGRLAGASIPHLHSQLVGTSFIPLRPAREGDAFARAARCPLCDLTEHSLIAETEHYRWMAPRGSRLGYQQWIVPKSHENDLNEPRELASLLQSSVRAMRGISDSFNWALIPFPHQPRGHWYVELFPRIAMIAGYELGTGTFINSIDPIDAAKALSGANTPDAAELFVRRGA